MNKEILKPIDYTIPSVFREVKFLTDIPTREDWVSEAIQKLGSVDFFTTYGSKIDGMICYGVFCKKLNVNLPDHCSMFHAELIAIKEAVDWMKYNVISVRDVGIFTKSQAAIKVLQSVSITSKVV